MRVARVHRRCWTGSIPVVAFAGALEPQRGRSSHWQARGSVRAVRLAVVVMLRAVAAVCIAVAVLVSAITVVGAVLVMSDGSPFPDGLGWGRLVVAWLVVVAFLLAIARLATLAVRGLVDTVRR
jgi:hypothetical protein